jgi:hypothetical protein
MGHNIRCLRPLAVGMTGCDLCGWVNPDRPFPAPRAETWGFGRREVRGDPCGDPPLRTAGRLRALLATRAAR